jgi:hypothetical protein
MADLQHTQHLSEDDAFALSFEGESAGRRDLAKARRHLLECRECQSRVQALQIEARLARNAIEALPVPELSAQRRSQTLAAIDGAARPKGSVRRLWVASRRSLAAAAGVTLLLGGAAVGAQTTAFQRFLDRIVGQPEESHVVTAPPVEDRVHARDAVIGIVPSGDELTLRFTRVQPDGVLVLRAAAGAGATFTVDGRGEGVGVEVLPGEIRFDNEPAGAERFGASIPESVKRIVVQIADREPVMLEFSRIATLDSLEVRLDESL